MKRIIALLCCFVFFCGCTNIKKENKKEENAPEEIRCVWLSIYDMGVLQCLSEGGFRIKAESIFKDINEKGFNHVFVQVRPYSDAFYESEIFPWSKYCSGVQGKSPGYDFFGIMVELAHKYSLKIHAWINPYRIASSVAEMEKLSDNNPAKIMYQNTPTDIYFASNGIYYNPASDRVRKLILDGIREIIEKYKVDGVHIDDFFYPTTNEEIDKKEYEEYKRKAGEKSLAEFRINQVNAFVTGMYSLIKSKNKSIIVSISPSGDIEKNKTTLYADVKEWSTENGYCDWIIPQVYYGFENEKMPFEDVLKVWKNLVTNKNIKLIIGLGFYKAGQTDFYAGKGKNEWTENDDVLSRQLKTLRKENCDGFSAFSYGSIVGKEWENFRSEMSLISSS